MHLVANSSILQRGAGLHSGSLALLPRWPVPPCPPPLYRPPGCPQAAQLDGQEAYRRVVHVGELVDKPKQSGRYYMWLSEASVCFMSGLRPLVPRITNLKISTITPTFCRPFQQQPPQHQPTPHRPSLRASRWPGLSYRPTWTKKVTSHPRLTTAGPGPLISPGPFTGGQSKAALAIATPSAVWRDRGGWAWRVRHGRNWMLPAESSMRVSPPPSSTPTAPSQAP